MVFLNILNLVNFREMKLWIELVFHVLYVFLAGKLLGKYVINFGLRSSLLLFKTLFVNGGIYGQRNAFAGMVLGTL